MTKDTFDQKSIDQKNIDQKNIDQKSIDVKSTGLKTTDLKSRLLALLARREHSRRELVDKLRGQSACAEQLDALLDELQSRGLQSDVRFAESFVRSRIGRGQGPERIRQELRRKGVATDLAALSLNGQAVDWFQLAREVRDKRFGLGAPDDRKSHARQVRFLLYRGFSVEQVQEAMNARPEQSFSG